MLCYLWYMIMVNYHYASPKGKKLLIEISSFVGEILQKQDVF